MHNNLSNINYYGIVDSPPLLDMYTFNQYKELLGELRVIIDTIRQNIQRMELQPKEVERNNEIRIECQRLVEHKIEVIKQIKTIYDNTRLSKIEQRSIIRQYMAERDRETILGRLRSIKNPIF